MYMYCICHTDCICESIEKDLYNLQLRVFTL